MRTPLLFGWLLAALLVLSSGDGARAGHSNAHWDFERPESVDDWSVFTGAASRAPGRGVDGSAAAALTVGSASVARIVHQVTVVPGADYRLGGRVLSTGGDIEWAQLGFLLYRASGARLDFDGELLTAPGGWSFARSAPCEAIGGEIEVAVRGAPGSTAHVDELWLELVATPDTPCPPPPTSTPASESQPPPADDAPASADDAAASELAAFGQQSAPAAPTGLLANRGFEAAEDDRLLGWRTFGGVLTQTATPVHGGRFAGAFSSASESTKWVYQTVRVTPAAWYRFDGYVYLNDPRAEAALLRISWYTSADGSGRAVATADSTSQLAEPAARYRYLTTGPVRAPPGVHSAKLRILLRPRSAATAVIYIDDVSFRPSAPGAIDAVSSRDAARIAAARAALGVAQRSGAFPLTPFPTPVIVRSAQLRVAAEPPSDGATWWPWVAVGGAMLVVSAAGGGAWWWRRRAAT